jgi:hypothetical protein
MSAAAAIAILANAIKANGILVRVEPEEFQKIVRRVKEPLVVSAKGGIFTTSYQYLVSYKGFAFFTKSAHPLILPTGTETISVKKIWIPT